MRFLVRPNLLYYIHHHGHGHFSRFSLLAKELQKSFELTVVCCSRTIEEKLNDSFNVVRLEDKWNSILGDPCFSPIERTPYSFGAQARSDQFTKLIRNKSKMLFLSDYSMELSLIARLSGVPTVIFKQHGHYLNDPLSKITIDSAELLIAPFPNLEEFNPWEDKTIYTGFFSRYSPEQKMLDNFKDVTIIPGSSSELSDSIETLAISNPSRVFTVIGIKDFQSKAKNVVSLGRVKSIKEYLNTKIVITAAGNNSIAEILSLGINPIIVPEERPFKEQLHKAELLEKQNLAVKTSTLELKTTFEKVLAKSKKLDSVNTIKHCNKQAPKLIRESLVETYERVYE
tara:strand:+ start:183440 stop:184465 length:1026 start_codon:yes stop_codon:yes gene_type:complete